MSNFDNPYFRYSLLLREIDNLRCAEDVSTIALVLMKLDGLDEVNERFGYLGGDKVLEETASRVAGIAREKDRSFEISGKSFALLISNPMNDGHALLAAQKIAKLASVPVVIGAERARVKARMGVSVMRDKSVNAEELLRQCELALHEARAQDESYVAYSPEVEHTRDSDVVTGFDLEHALEQSQLEVYYQPKLSLRSGKLAGAEALVRWQSPVGGLIAPSRFLPVIENTQGIHDLLWFVLNAALRCAADWIGRVPDFTIAVNLAPENLNDPDLAEVVENVLRMWSFPAHRLLLEITETTIMSDSRASATMLDKLRGIGVRTAIDDFGTGYSSLSYLKELPADELKIDQSFVRSMATNETDKRIVGLVIQLARAVGLETVAEGIEDADTMESLIALGCDIGQGFHFSGPVPAGEFEADWIARFAHTTLSEAG